VYNILRERHNYQSIFAFEIENKDRTQICEGSVNLWNQLIKNILKQNFENDSHNGNNPITITEVAF
jgi:hypothetical protein